MSLVETRKMFRKYKFYIQLRLQYLDIFQLRNPNMHLLKNQNKFPFHKSSIDFLM